MTYIYDRTKVADSDYGSSQLSYENRLSSLQATFTGEIGRKLFEYIETLHGRIRNREPFENMSGFTSWDYGSPRELGPNRMGIRVWQKSSSTYPGDLEPNIFVTVEFGTKVEVEAKAGSEVLLKKTVGQNSSSSISIALAVGEAWEEKLTGNVEYSRDERKYASR